MVAYFPLKGKAVFTFDSGIRKDGSATLQTGTLKGIAAETWIGFLSSDEKDASDSVYAGALP